MPQRAAKLTFLSWQSTQQPFTNLNKLSVGNFTMS